MNTQNNITNRFSKLLYGTHCPFAKNATLQFANEWDTNLDFEANLPNLVSSFEDFAYNESQVSKELFVIEVTDEKIINNIRNFAGFFNRLLNEIHKKDKQSEQHFTVGINKMEWDFLFNKIKFFVVTFAPFYSCNHPRYSFNEKSAFIMFQPDMTFDKYNINSKNTNRLVITEKIKDLFLENGFSYNLNYVKGSLKAIRYIKPISVHGKPIKWWNYKKFL